MYNEQKYVVHIKTLMAVLNYGLVSHKVHRVIKFNQESWLKSYIIITLLVFPNLYMSKVVIYEYWYNCANPKYGDKTKLC